MARFAGQVGYITQTEKAPGVWTADENPRMMKGDMIRQTSSNQNGDKVNKDVTLGHRVSVMGDAYAFDNYYNIKWVMIDGFKWEVTSIEIQRPRLILSVGGMWNEE